jgi:hypothetical protein
MHQLDVQARKLLAAERFELLLSEAQPTGRVRGQLRRRTGQLLVAAGHRLAPEAPPRSALSRDAAHRITTLKG